MPGSVQSLLSSSHSYCNSAFTALRLLRGRTNIRSLFLRRRLRGKRNRPSAYNHTRGRVSRRKPNVKPKIDSTMKLIIWNRANSYSPTMSAQRRTIRVNRHGYIYLSGALAAEMGLGDGGRNEDSGLMSQIFLCYSRMWLAIAGVGQLPRVVPKLNFSTPEFSTHRCLPEENRIEGTAFSKTCR